MTKKEESWADWILSSYSDSISPVSDDSTTTTNHPSADEPDNTADSSSSTQPAASSPYGLYTKTGRGGVGNFGWAGSSTHLSNADDVEAPHGHELARQMTAPVMGSRELLASQTRRKRPGNIYTGRGGVGNSLILSPNGYGERVESPRSPGWPSPMEPPAQLLLPGTPRTPTPSVTMPPGALGHVGRGGIGNVALLREQDSGDVHEEERRAGEAVRERVEGEVESLLRVPEGALVKGARRRESALLTID